MAGSKTESKSQIACNFSVKIAVTALHNVALEKAEAIGDGGIYTIQNTAIDGSGKDSKYYGAGSHIIAAIPKEAKGLDKNKITKSKALACIQEYISWFVGPDLKGSINEKDLIPLEDEDSGKIEDTSAKKKDIEKSRNSAEGSDKVSTASKEKYKESKILIPSFSQFLLNEDIILSEDDPKSDSNSNKNSSSDKDSKTESEESSAGYFIAYQLEEKPGEKGKPLKDALKKFSSLVGDFFKGIGIKFGSWKSNNSGEVHTIGDVTNKLADIFGKIDKNEFLNNYNENVKKTFQSDAQSQIIQSNIILKHLKKQLSNQDKAKIKSTELSLCTKVNKKDKSYKLFNKGSIAKCITSSIKGIVKKFKNNIDPKDIILVNNYSDNEENSSTERKAGEVNSSLINNYNTTEYLTEAITLTPDEANKKLKELIADLPKEWEASSVVSSTENIIKLLQKAGIDEARWFNDLQKAGKHSFLIKVKSQEQNESKTLNNKLLNVLFEKILDKDDSQLDRIKNIFDKFILGYKDKLQGEELKTDQIDALKGRVSDKPTTESITNNTYNFMQNLYEDYSLIETRLLLEGHCPEWKELVDVVKSLDPEIFNTKPKKDKKTKKRGPDAAEKLRAAYEKHLKAAKNDKRYKDSEYTQKIDTGSENWINKTIIGHLHPDENNKVTNDGLMSRFEEAFKGKNRETSDERPEIYAIAQALKDVKKEYPDTEPPKSEEPPEKPKPPKPTPLPPEIEEFEYKFFDYDPENPDDEEPNELKSGKVEKGGSITPPKSPEHEDFEFIGWKPDNFDDIQGPITYVSQYAKVKPATFPVTFFDWKFEDGEPVEISEIDTQWVEKGKSATAPADPDHTDYGWKFIGWNTKFDNITEPTNVTAEYQNLIKIQPKVPKDPKNPEDTENLGEPFEYNPEKPLIEQLPELPEKEGYKPDGWDPDPTDFDPNSVDNPKDPVIITGKYKQNEEETPKSQYVYYVIADENGLLEDHKLPIKFFNIDSKNPQDRDKWEPIGDDEYTDIEKVKYPDLSSIKDSNDKEASSWSIPQKELKNSYSKLQEDPKYVYTDKSTNKKYLAITPIYLDTYHITFINTDPDKPEDQSLWTEFEAAKVDVNGNETVNIPFDKIKDGSVKYPKQKVKSTNKDKPWAGNDDVALGWSPTLQELASMTEEDLKKLQDQSEELSFKTSDNKPSIIIKPIFKGNSFNIKIINTDPEDPDNTKSQKDICTIKVIDGLFKVDDLKARAKTITDKDTSANYLQAAKSNEEAFKAVDNIAAMDDKSKPYKLLGWTTDKNSSDKPSFEKVEIQDVVNQVLSSGEQPDEDITLKPVWSNSIKAKHTDIDYYIIPMKGLTNSKKQYDKKTGRTVEQK